MDIAPAPRVDRGSTAVWQLRHLRCARQKVSAERTGGVSKGRATSVALERWVGPHAGGRRGSSLLRPPYDETTISRAPYHAAGDSSNSGASVPLGQRPFYPRAVTSVDLGDPPDWFQHEHGDRFAPTVATEELTFAFLSLLTWAHPANSSSASTRVACRGLLRISPSNS